MENPQDPYQTPNATAPGANQMPPQPPSAIPKVFGILHIIYAAIGGLVALFSLGAGAVLKATLKPLQDQAEKEGKSAEALTDAADSIVSISMIQSLASIGFAILLLVAGIKLLKYQEGGRKLSNIWAIARIVVAIPLTFMALNAQSNFQDEIKNIVGASSSLDLGGAMGGIGIVGVLLVSIYPIISLILVNQAKSKAALK